MSKQLFLLTVLLFPLNSFCQRARNHADQVSEAQLIRNCRFFLDLSEKELLSMVPPQAGFRFCGSPESLEGAQENNMIWKPEFGEKVQCRFTGTFFPNQKYPENGFIDFETPSGKPFRFNYHQDENGKKYWFEARKWYEQRVLMERTAWQLARLYSTNPEKYKKAGKYSALIIRQFAKLYPDYIITFDYPGREKAFYNQETYPEEVIKRKHDAWRLSKWSWWAYADVSENLLLAYDLVREGKFLSADEERIIETDLFGSMLTFVDRYAHIATTNMHPTLWRAQAAAANVLQLPALKDSVNKGISQMLKQQFTHDGFWKEVSVSYHRQTASGISEVFKRLYPMLGEEELAKKMQEMHPALSLALKADETFRLPNGHYASINDTWSYDSYSPLIESSSPKLKTGVGYGVLGMGTGPDQLQAHLNFNGHFGHDHYANLNLTLFAKGKELLSDIGYTHTKARTWATSTTAHNLVVINGKSQQGRELPYAGTGDLLLFNGNDSGFQVTEADAANCYAAENISMYRRALIAVECPGKNHYVVDLFNVRGPGRKDWIMHGSADEPQQISTALTGSGTPEWTEKTSLMPEGLTFTEIPDLFNFRLLWEPYWSHGNFKNIKQAHFTGPFKNTFQYTRSPGKGLQTWFPSAKGGTVSQAASWNVRGAAENQGKLDENLRTSLLVTSDDTAARFTAVHVPFEGAPPVTNVKTVHEDENSVVIRIQVADGTTDFIVYQLTNQPVSVRIGNQKLDFDGRVGFVRLHDNQVTMKMIGGNYLQMGSHRISGNRTALPLKAVSGNKFEVPGKFEIEPGEIFIVSHGNGKTSSFHVESVVYDAHKTTLETVEPPVFTFDENQTLKMDVFPFFEFPGPHSVRSSRLSKGKFAK